MIINQSKDIIISQKELVCKSFFSQARGLMLRKRQNLVMVFPDERRIQLHNLLVFFPLEIIVLNKNKMVVDINPHFARFSPGWGSYGQYVIELGEEYSKHKVELGNRIELQ